MDPSIDSYKNMLNSFRAIDFERLFEACNMRKTERESEYKKKAMDLLSTFPLEFNRNYLTKINEIYNSNQFHETNTNIQSITTGSPQVQRKSVICANYNIQNDQRPGTSYGRPITDSTPENSSFNQTTKQTTQLLTDVKLTKSPFYEVIREILKPTISNNSNTATGVKIEVKFNCDFTPEDINRIALNRDFSSGKKEFIYEVHIRIGRKIFENKNEIFDCFPRMLKIKVCNAVCIVSQINLPRPIKCTHLLKLNPSIKNVIQISWISDNFNYFVALNLVKKLSSDTLLQNLKDKSVRSLEETKSFIIKKLATIKLDLETTNQNISLVCPLSKTRMKTPAKLITCDHIQCFDAYTFLLMNEKKPTWACPICNTPCLYDDMYLDSYFLEIVNNSTLPDGCKQIRILPDGSWKIDEKDEGITNTEIRSAIESIDFVNLDSDDESTVE